MSAMMTKQAVLDQCEDTIIDFMINVTPYPPTQHKSIRDFISGWIIRIAAQYKIILTDSDITDKVDLLERMYVAYCTKQIEVYGEYFA